MVDRFFADASLAALYDAFYPKQHRRDLDFYLPLLMSAPAVLDVGCGTGALLRSAREKGHQGRLCGIDPGAGMIEQARGRTDVEWLPGTLDSSRWSGEFDLAVMTGHAFQVLIEDEELLGTLRGIRTALKPGGRFAFETRNPRAREWERWTPAAAETIDFAGRRIRMVPDLERPYDGRTVTFSLTFTSPEWDRPRVSRTTLRFLDPHSLSSLLIECGFQIEAVRGLGSSAADRREPRDHHYRQANLKPQRRDPVERGNVRNGWREDIA